MGIVLIDLNITDKEMREYKKKFLGMEVESSLEESIKKGIELGIPIAYFIKTSIVNEGNFRDFRDIGDELYNDLEMHFSGKLNTFEDIEEEPDDSDLLLLGIGDAKEVESTTEVDTDVRESEDEVISSEKEEVSSNSNTAIQELNERVEQLEDKCNELEDALGEIKSLLENYTGSNYKRKNALMISSYANKGGVGKTTVAVSIAKVIAEMGKRTLLCDFDFGGRNVTAFFGIQDDYGNYFDNLGKLDKHLINVAENLYILPGSIKIQSKSISGKDIDKLFSKLKTQFDVIVMDTCPSPYEKRYMHTVLSKSDLVFAVVDQNKFSREETKEYGGKLLYMGVKPENIRIVVNRYDSNLVSLDEVEDDFNKGLGKSKFRVKTLAVIPNDWVGVNLATDEGKIANREVWKELYNEVNKAYNTEDIKRK